MSGPSAIGENFAALAATLRARRDGIVDTWMQRCRQEVEAARHLAELELQDSVQALLSALNKAVENCNTAEGAQDGFAKDAQIARLHGEERHRQLIYDLVQVIHEYRLLRMVVLETLFEAHVELSRTAISVVNQFFDIAISEAAETFTQMQFEEQTLQIEAERQSAEQRADSMQAENASIRHNQLQAIAQLQQTQGQLNQLGQVMEAKEQFVSFLSHDLRSPLSAIILTAQLLARRLHGTPHIPLVERIARSATKADNMVRDLLDARRGATKPMQLEFQDCDLSVTVRRLHQELVERFGPRFVVTCPEQVFSHWDATALERALENLCSNAVKYGDSSAPIEVNVATHADTVTVSVKNAGQPISKADQRRLFKPYYRSSGAQTGPQEGWGLGLAYVSQVAQLHGGDVKVTSDEQDGTVFSLSFPVDARRAFGT